MSFRLSSVNICRAGIVSFACLAFAGASRAGEGARNIEVVPSHGAPIDTNFDQSTPEDAQTFKPWSPQAPHTAQPAPRMTDIMPPPSRPQSTLSAAREMELLDRRRNWVFMTPEDYASSDGKKDGLEDNSLGKKSTTVMERYYQHLYEADRPTATNQFGKLDANRSGDRTNLLTGELRNPNDGSFHDSPFNAVAGPGVFQTVRRVDSSNPFGSDNSGAMRTPEEVQMEAEQKAHMDSFRQLWNIDQPAPAPAPSSVSAPVDSGPLFGLSSPSIRPGNSSSFSDAGSSSTKNQVLAPKDTPPRYSKAPPHADFAAPQRPF